MRLFSGLLLSFFLLGTAAGQLNPLSILGRAVTTSMDARTKAEVSADTEIGAGASKRLLDDKKAEWKGVTVMVFAQHMVIAGAVKSAEVKKRVEEVVLMGVAQSQQEAAAAVKKIRGIKGVKSVRSHLRVVPAKR